jgi:predicted nucleic acid-binding protein
MNLVIDASVLIKFFIPEILSEKAKNLHSQVAKGDLSLVAPDLIFPEVGNILWKMHRRKELTRSEVTLIVDAIVSMPMEIEASKQLLPSAVDLGLVCGITVYDAIYVSLAMIREMVLMTADRRLADIMGRTDFKRYVAWLGDYVQ